MSRVWAIVVSTAALMLGGAALAANVSRTEVTFHKDVLPILQKNCQNCHRPGQIGPMSLLTYDEARPWAKSIKQAVITRKMPPWFAYPDTAISAMTGRCSPRKSRRW
jgi:mono/diheme cytochrome c family protein